MPFKKKHKQLFLPVIEKTGQALAAEFKIPPDDAIKFAEHILFSLYKSNLLHINVHLKNVQSSGGNNGKAVN